MTFNIPGPSLEKNSTAPHPDTQRPNDVLPQRSPAPRVVAQRQPTKGDQSQSQPAQRQAALATPSNRDQAARNASQRDYPGRDVSKSNHPAHARAVRRSPDLAPLRSQDRRFQKRRGRFIADWHDALLKTAPGTT
jgi:hypothetical protein